MVHCRWSVLQPLFLLLLLGAGPLSGREMFVAPNGDDNAEGSLESPYRTIDRAESQASGGDTVWLRGGLHPYSETVRLNRSGQPDPTGSIRLWAYPGEQVILDFQTAGGSDRGINLRGSYWHLKGLTIQNAGDNGVIVYGAHNTLERLIARRNGDSGIQLHTGASANLILNCDSYLNVDLQNGGENADGFAAKFSLGEGNTFVGCRSWSNSDDGYDFWEAGNGVTVEQCWAFANGENHWGIAAYQGDGNGFKLGHGSGAHLLIGCLAFNHPTHGIDVNGNLTGVTIYNCTCVANKGRNFYFDEHADVHVMRNNLSYAGRVLVYNEIDDAYNTWNGQNATEEDFRSLDPNGIAGPREADGGLPRLPFLRLASTSSLIDAGLDVGTEFRREAPDLGAFELLDGDCDGNGLIGHVDLGCFASTWLQVDDNGRVDWIDFAQWAGNWAE